MLQKAGKVTDWPRGVDALQAACFARCFQNEISTFTAPCNKRRYLKKKADALQKVTHFCFFTLSSSLRRYIYIAFISTPFHVPDAMTPILYYVCIYTGCPRRNVPDFGRVFLMWSSGQSFWLQIQRSRVRSPALPDFLSSSGSGTRSTQPREPREVN